MIAMILRTSRLWLNIYVTVKEKTAELLRKLVKVPYFKLLVRALLMGDAKISLATEVFFDIYFSMFLGFLLTIF